VLLAACVLSAGSNAQELLRISIGHGAGAGQLYSSSLPTSVTTLDGARVVLQRASGREYGIEAGHEGWSWFQVQQVPAQSSYIAVTPRLEGQEVSLDITIAEKTGEQFTSIGTSASGALGEWIELVGYRTADTGSRQYSSSAGRGQLAIKVEKTR